MIARPHAKKYRPFVKQYATRSKNLSKACRPDVMKSNTVQILIHLFDEKSVPSNMTIGARRGLVVLTIMTVVAG